MRVNLSMLLPQCLFLVAAISLLSSSSSSSFSSSTANSPISGSSMSPISFASAASGSNSSDGDDVNNQYADGRVRAIGVPIIYGIFFFCGLVLAKQQFSTSFKATSYNPVSVWVIRASCLCAALSLFFFISAAWGYGLMSSVIAFYLACIVDSLDTNANMAACVLFVWFLILIGVPANVSSGIIRAISNPLCADWYGPYYGDKMCSSGWVTVLLVLATLQICLTFLSVIAVLAAKASNEALMDIDDDESATEGSNYSNDEESGGGEELTSPIARDDSYASSYH